jgi:hypothetical protein
MPSFLSLAIYIRDMISPKYFFLGILSSILVTRRLIFVLFESSCSTVIRTYSVPLKNNSTSAGYHDLRVACCPSLRYFGIVLSIRPRCVKVKVLRSGLLSIEKPIDVQVCLWMKYDSIIGLRQFIVGLYFYIRL